MLLIAGIDPGLTGAIAIYDADADRLIAVWDIPTFKEKVGASERRRLDVKGLKTLLHTAELMGVAMVGIEKVQGWGGKGQSASAGFQFGYVFGKIESAVEDVFSLWNDFPFVSARPDVWKLRDKVPKDAKAIAKMAKVAFPGHGYRFYGPKGAPLHDRAEAALLARYFARRVWPMLQIAPSYKVGEISPATAEELASVKPLVVGLAAPRPKRKPRKTK